MAAPLFCFDLLKQEAERDRNELVHAAFGCAPRNAMVARLKECCERTEPECGPGSGVEAKIVFSLGAGDVRLGVVEPATGNDIHLSVRSGKRKYQIPEHSTHAEIASAWRRTEAVAVQNVVVNGI